MPINSKKYLVTKELYSNGKIIKLFARELGGVDIVSGNYFTPKKVDYLNLAKWAIKK